MPHPGRGGYAEPRHSDDGAKRLALPALWQGLTQTDNRQWHGHPGRDFMGWKPMPRDFKELYKSSVPTWVNHWRYNWDTDIRLDVPAEKVYIKYTGQPGLNAIRACMHVIPERPPQTQIRITHGYQIDQQLRQETIDLDGPATYTIRCDEEPENVFIKVSVPSS